LDTTGFRAENLDIY